MKLNILYSHGKRVAICKDKFLIELYIVQRNITDFCVQIKDSKKDIKYFDDYLRYYFGYAITNKELNFITEQYGQYKSDIEFMVLELETFYNTYKKHMTKKEKKNIKDTIKLLNDKYENKDLIFSEEMVDILLNEREVVDEFMYGLEMFKNMMNDPMS